MIRTHRVIRRESKRAKNIFGLNKPLPSGANYNRGEGEGVFRGI